MSKIIKIILIAGLMFYSHLSFAQETKQQHPIDAFLGKCMEQDSSTAGMRDCYGKAYQMWDKELNKGYKGLMSSLGPDAKKALKTSQAMWIKYRDSEFKLNNEIVGTREGTMWLLVGDGDRVEFVKRRALELKRYLEIMNE